MKKGLALLMPGDEEDGTAPEEKDGAMAEEAAQSVIDAIADEDPKALVSAMRSLIAELE